MATTIEATYRVDGSCAELRLPSFKGVLRFWWRALAWSRCGGDLGAIKQQEDALFGSAGAGQSRILMRLVADEKPASVAVGQVLTVTAGDTAVVGEGARYLGYGVMEAFARGPRDGRPGTKTGQLTRACLRPPIEFTVCCRARDLEQGEVQSLKDALISVGTLGGMGAKSRKGYGALVLRSLRANGNNAWARPTTIDELKGKIAALYPADTRDALPEFTALSKNARHVLLPSDRVASLAMLDLVGRELVRFRSRGRNRKILGGGVDSERRFEDDHDLMKTIVSEREVHPRRIAFGLPHNYGKPKDQQVGPHDSELDRRASPLFIHIHECGETPVAVVSFLPARFLPDGRSDISVGGQKIEQKPEVELYRPIHDFLDRLLDAKQRREPFTAAVEVRP
jgi:CRISPR-associated protein Cmr1